MAWLKSLGDRGTCPSCRGALNPTRMHPAVSEISQLNRGLYDVNTPQGHLRMVLIPYMASSPLPDEVLPSTPVPPTSVSARGDSQAPAFVFSAACGLAAAFLYHYLADGNSG
jgi:hypothetical protein